MSPGLRGDISMNPEAPFRLPPSSVMLPEHLAKAREMAGVRLP